MAKPNAYLNLPLLEFLSIIDGTGRFMSAIPSNEIHLTNGDQLSKISKNFRTYAFQKKNTLLFELAGS